MIIYFVHTYLALERTGMNSHELRVRVHDITKDQGIDESFFVDERGLQLFVLT